MSFPVRLLALVAILIPTTISAQENAVLAWTMPWDADWVTAVTFVGKNRVVAGNNLGQIMAWDLPENLKDPAPKAVREFKGHTNVINRLLTSPDGKTLYSASNDHTIRIWNPHGPSAKKGTFVTNARAIAEAETKKKKVPAPLESPVDVVEDSKVLTHPDWVVAMSMSKDGKTLASGDEKGEVIVWDASAGTERKRWKVKGWVWALALTPNGEMLAVSERMPLVFDSGRHTGLKIWSSQGEMKIDISKAFDKQAIGALAYSPDGKTLAIGRGGEGDGKMSVADAATGKILKELTPMHISGVTDMVFHPEGKYLATCGRDTMIRLWDVESGKLLKALGQQRGGQFKDWIHTVAFSPDGRWLAAADMAGMVHVYSLNGGDAAAKTADAGKKGE